MGTGGISALSGAGCWGSFLSHQAVVTSKFFLSLTFFCLIDFDTNNSSCRLAGGLQVWDPSFLGLAVSESFIFVQTWDV